MQYLQTAILVLVLAACGDSAMMIFPDASTRDAHVPIDGGGFPDATPAADAGAPALDAGAPADSGRDVGPVTPLGQCRPFRDGTSHVSHTDCDPVAGRPVCDTSVALDDSGNQIHLCVAEPVGICDACSDQEQCDAAQPGSVCAFLPPIIHEGEPIHGESGCLWPCELDCDWLAIRWSIPADRITCREGFCIPNFGAMTCQSTMGPGRI